MEIHASKYKYGYMLEKRKEIQIQCMTNSPLLAE